MVEKLECMGKSFRTYGMGMGTFSYMFPNMYEKFLSYII